MANGQDYVSFIRGKVGKDKIFMNYSACAILNDDNEILLQRRVDNGKWGIPGGIVELEKDFRNAARREALEETGMDVEIGDLVGVYSAPEYSFNYPSGHEVRPVLVVFYAKIKKGNIKTFPKDETQDLKFFSKDNLPKIGNKEVKRAVEDALEGKTGVFT